jgi:putative acetyltransferase
MKREFRLRHIEPADDPIMASIIREVMPEFGASGPGFAINDPEVDFMHAAFTRPGAAYFVIVNATNQVLGGGGVAPLDGGPSDICELKKMYFLPELRGHGMGRVLIGRCLSQAKELGYRTVYVETLTGMDAAQHLYRQAGFRPRGGPLGATGHHGCDRYYELDLSLAGH